MLEPIKLDKVDKQLLFELDFHARDDFGKLAERVGITPQNAEKRMYNLIEKGVIKGFHPVLNIPKLGYIYCRLLLTLQNVTEEDKKDIVDFLINHPNVFWVFRMQGIYDFMAVIWVENVDQFTDFIDEIEDRFGKYIKRRLETIASNVAYFQNRYLTNLIETEEIHVKETRDHMLLDKLDRRILQLLSINARFTTTEIALNLKEKESVVSKKIKELEKKKIIEGYRPLIDHALLGYTWYKIWLNVNKTSQKDYKELQGYIKNNPITLYTVKGIGLPADLDIEVMVNSNQELFDFIDDMRTKFPTMIDDYTTVVFVETLKELYLPFY